MLGCGIKQTNHSRYSAPPAPPAPQRTWTGEGMSPKGLGWKQESRCQLAFQTLNDVDKEAWGGGSWRHVTQQTRLPKMCGAIFHFSLDSETTTPQPAIITSETKVDLAPVCSRAAFKCNCSDNKESLLSSSCLSQLIFHHCWLDFYGFQMASDVENAPSLELWGADSRQMHW